MQGCNIFSLQMNDLMVSTSQRAMEPKSPPENFPAIFRGKLKGWKIVNYTEEDWRSLFRDRLLKFRQGRRAFTKAPCWEHLCEYREMTLGEFFEVSTQSDPHWLYFDYKYLRDVFPEDKAFVDEVDWSDLQLFSLDREESALWIGNAGAHTPCHKDSYGCNVVVQLFGRKMWILMPPEEDEALRAVRVPYEESSVYSLCNFFTPNDALLRVRNAYKVVLSPGDVLYVPRHWWHYVENLQPAISINTWVPLAEDHESRLEESLVQHYVSVICRDLAEDEWKQILNPGEYSLMGEPCTLEAVEKCLEECRKERGGARSAREVRKKLRGEVAALERIDLGGYIDERSRTYKYDASVAPAREESERKSRSRVSVATALINAYCRPENINAVKDALLNV